MQSFLFKKGLLLHKSTFFDNISNLINKVEKKTYTFEEAQNATLEYFGGDALAARVWANKYAMKDSLGNIYEETPRDMHWRIANEIARVEAKYPNALSAQQLFDLLDHFRYIVPQGSPMTGIGNNYQIASLSNCFVIGMDGNADSYGAIIRVDEEQVQLMKRRGGVGHDLSHIRPKGSPVKNSALTSTGLVPIHFLRIPYLCLLHKCYRFYSENEFALKWLFPHSYDCLHLYLL